MNNLMISIVLPTYNGSKYIEETIKSIIKQTYNKWELIIVDDCSTDETPIIIKKYINLDKRIRSVRHVENLKLPASLNTGFSHAKGEYFTWISDDNYYHQQAFKEMVDFLDSNPEVDIVYTDYAVINEEGGYIGTKIRPAPPKLLFGNGIGPSFLYRKRVQLNIGNYSEDFFTAEDYEFWLRCSFCFRMISLHKVLFYYRIHKMSLSFQKEKYIWRMADKALLKYIHKIKWANSQEKAQSFIHLTYRVFRRFELLNAIRFIICALLYAPIFTITYSIKRINKFWSSNS